ncbi:MAG: hypothetical protein Q9163_005804 [Psora crenata]
MTSQNIASETTSPVAQAATRRPKSLTQPPPPEPDLEEKGASDAATSLLTGFTPQQLASISRIVDSAVKTALHERPGPANLQSAAHSVKATKPRRRVPNTASITATAPPKEGYGSASQLARPMERVVACNEDSHRSQQSQTRPPEMQSLPLASQQIQIHDFQSNCKELRYRSDFLRLPRNTPRDHPHIVDTTSIGDEFPQGEIGFADLVVTILFMHDPRLLNDFLDFNKHSFDFQRVSTRGGALVPYIERRIRFVTCGLLNTDGKTVKESITYRIMNEGTGAWAPISVQGPLCKTLIGPRRIEDHVRTTFAPSLLRDKIWERQEDSKFIIRAR